MFKNLKRKYHYHVAMFWSDIHRFAVKRFHYHVDKHAEYGKKLGLGGNEDDRD